MSIKSKASMPHRKIEVDLTGPEGNAFCLLAMAKGWAKDLDKDWEPLRKEATDGDYEHLLKVLDREFGMFVDFLR
jgi:hypothetical protein